MYDSTCTSPEDSIPTVSHKSIGDRSSDILVFKARYCARKFLAKDSIFPPNAKINWKQNQKVVNNVVEFIYWCDQFQMDLLRLALAQ
jgi:hypothetical protein